MVWWHEGCSWVEGVPGKGKRKDSSSKGEGELRLIIRFFGRRRGKTGLPEGKRRVFQARTG